MSKRTFFQKEYKFFKIKVQFIHLDPDPDPASQINADPCKRINFVLEIHFYNAGTARVNETVDTFRFEWQEDEQVRQSSALPEISQSKYTFRILPIRISL